jgi:translation initiation factor IF-3
MDAAHPSARTCVRCCRVKRDALEAPGGSGPPGGCAFRLVRRFLFVAQRAPKRRRTIIDKNEPRVNNQIRISPVRLVDAEGEQVGIVSIEDARAAAAARGLDLVEVAPGARPPVVRIMDYGKYKYEQARKARESKKKQHQVQVKEIKLRPKIEEHDINFKARHARRFLTEGNKVKLTMRFRGREMTHTELGAAVLERFAGNLEDVGQIEEQPRMEGRQMTMVLAPRRN